MQLPRIDAHLSPSHFLTFSLSHFLLHHSDTSDGRRWSVVCRVNGVIPATSGSIYHQGSKAPREEPQGGQGGQDIFTTKAQRWDEEAGLGGVH
jgi:hypothetical protein